MAQILERQYKSGESSFRVTLRKRGVSTFCITFNDFEEAYKWIEKHENDFYKNPDKYFQWREEIYHKLTRSRQKSYQHVVKPKLRIDSRS